MGVFLWGEGGKRGLKHPQIGHINRAPWVPGMGLGEWTRGQGTVLALIWGQSQPRAGFEQDFHFCCGVFRFHLLGREKALFPPSLSTGCCDSRVRNSRESIKVLWLDCRCGGQGKAGGGESKVEGRLRPTVWVRVKETWEASEGF